MFRLLVVQLLQLERGQTQSRRHARHGLTTRGALRFSATGHADVPRESCGASVFHLYTKKECHHCSRPRRRLDAGWPFRGLPIQESRSANFLAASATTR